MLETVANRQRQISALGRNLRRLREARGWSQQELSDRSDVSRPVIARLELGTSGPPSLETAERLAKALGVSLDALTADPNTAAGAAHMEPLVEAFLGSDLAHQLPGGPVTEEELAWLRSIPVVYWGGSPPTPASIYHLILARRASRS